MSRVATPARPVVPNRPVAPPIPTGRANIPPAVAASPVAAPRPTPTPPVAASNNSAAPVAATPTDAAAAQPKKRGRKAGAGGKARKAQLPEYHGTYEYGADGNATQIQDGNNEDGSPRMVYKRVKLTTIPTDFDSAKHAKLKSSDFADEAMFLDFRATQLETTAKKFRGRAEQLRKIENVDDRKKVNRLEKMREQMAKLEESLKSQGVDTNALLGVSAADGA